MTLNDTVRAAPRFGAQRKPIGATDLVARGLVGDGQTRLRLITPAVQALDLLSWIEGNRAELARALAEQGGILLRGFEGQFDPLFAGVVARVIDQLQPYLEGATPRTRVGEGVYTSTEFPQDQTIAQHNELSYVNNWPMKICFACRTAAEEGGATPLTDVRAVLANLDPALVREFEQRGWMLIRNYGAGLGPGWRKVFNTDAIDDVRRYCEQAGIALEIFSDEKIRTRQVRQAVRRHPRTGQAVWFNHVAFWHPHSLAPSVRLGLQAQFAHDELPYATCWGDGQPIDDQVIDHINEAYRKATMRAPWQAGDIVLLDNMLIAHGRDPFKGPRSVVVAMGEPYDGAAPAGHQDATNNATTGEMPK